MNKTTIFDFLEFKYSKRTYGNTETVVNDICKMPVTLSNDDGNELVIYLLAKYVEKNDRYRGINTVSDSVYENISMKDNQIVCDRFDSEEPTRYDLLGNRLNEDSKLHLIELD